MCRAWHLRDVDETGLVDAMLLPRFSGQASRDFEEFQSLPWDENFAVLYQAAVFLKGTSIRDA